MKRLISALLSVLMIASCITGVRMTALADDTDPTETQITDSEEAILPSLACDETTTFAFEQKNQTIEYTFAPPQDGYYIFSVVRPMVAGSFAFYVYDSGVKCDTAKATYNVDADNMLSMNGYAYNLTADKVYTVSYKSSAILEISIRPYLHNEHDYVYDSTTQPKCNSLGSVKYKCSDINCGVSYNESLPATGEHVMKTKYVAPTCTDYGYTEHYCQNCALKYSTDYVAPDPQAHSYYNTGYCRYCDDFRKPSDISPLAVDGSNSVMVKKNSQVWCSITPSESGYYSIRSTGKYDTFAELFDSDFNYLSDSDDISGSNYNFDICAQLTGGKTYYVLLETWETTSVTFDVTVSAHNHKMTTERVTDKCVGKAYTMYSCTCGYYYTSDVTDIPVEHDYYTFVSDPTCNEEGYILHYCLECLDMYKTDPTPATGTHQFDKGICLVCGEKQKYSADGIVVSLAESEEKRVAFNGVGDEFCFAFVPSESGYYNISTGGIYDIDGIIADSDGNMLCYDRDGANGANFRLSADLIAGKCYYVVADVRSDAQGEFTITASRHDHIFDTLVVPPTCVGKGYTVYTCTDCFYSYQGDYTEATAEHRFVNGSCAVCETIDIGSFEFVPVLPDCEKTVSADGEGQFSFVPVHDGTIEFYSTGKLFPTGFITDCDLKPIDCESLPCDRLNFRLTANVVAGNTYYLISSCENSEYSVGFRYDFAHDFTSQVIAPTCTEQGYTLHTCSCGESYEDEFVDPLDHTYVTTKATLTKNGVAKCENCGSVKSTIYYPKTITLSATKYTYDGKVKKPTVKVVGSNGKAISASNYTVTYASGRKNVGKYAVKVTFKGNYSGSKILYFNINPKGTTLSSVSAGSKSFTAKWKKQATQTTGYQIQYATDSKFTKGVKTVTVKKNSTTSTKIAKLTGKKKYYVRIRTYKTVNKVNYYSAWSSAKAVTTKK